MPPSESQVLAKLKRANPSLVRSWAKRQAKAAAARSGYLVTKLDGEAQRYARVSHNDAVALPPGAEETLRQDNPRLAELQAAYDALDIPATAHTQWRQGFLKRNLSLAWFRGDNAYVWQFRQLRNAAEARMYLTLLDVESRDRLGLLKRLEEDGLFGAWTFTYGNRPPVSRDLLDSVNEISYLDAQMGLSSIDDLKVLDIGAGYGRVAHRMSAALPNLAAYDCIDGVATSTFLCDYYLDYRNVPDSVRVVPLPEYEKLSDDYDLAVNIHSFSECSLEAIEWWLDRIAERNIEWLLIVPNTPHQLLSTELDGSMKDFAPLVAAAGYEQVDERPVFENDELRALIDLHDTFHLFRRKDSAS
ncbi:putative sugar O-methyltransferase [Nocardioides antri]|uniref:Putative sugar O-methyltransferase n=1 Tax=Nocardioides antri TaxID=2607659 RepID=A0A5B1M3X4_9ACTN|nr:putative sugar O-methyltransferase [Nocardioides antri]KAA1427474.1 putative sugar O-methyltransferase [Nocardioides antri]